ncbi:MAG TPA: bifunctional riboflavin kinase/FAD synthetase [Chloroflexota bacterium]|nr:bifunctional riboflavin kinase/FAD synthetase [Chloroflexota bacterium]
MKVEHVDPLQSDSEPFGGCAITVGSFDGVHRGHQFLIRSMVDHARSARLESVVITFDPLPFEVLDPDAPAARLTELDEKLTLLEQLGVDRTAVVRFTNDVAAIPAEEFVLWICRTNKAQEIWAGADFAFGHRREGTVDLLEELGPELGFEATILPRVEFDGGRMASSVIRSMLGGGEVREAAVLLGRLPAVAGTIVHGAGRGQDLGYPTANLVIALHTLVPKTGIYAGFAVLGKERLPAAVSIGYNPTFGANPLSVEAYILDFDRDIFGERLRIEFVDRLRDELYFDSVDALVVQIGEDVSKVRSILAAYDRHGRVRRGPATVKTWRKRA